MTNAEIEGYQNRIQELEQEVTRYKTYARLLGQIAHEHRTSMSPILGFSHLLLQTTTLTEEQTEYVKILLYNGGYPLLHQINRFVDFTKLVAGTLPLYPELFELRTLLEPFPDALAFWAAKKGITVSMLVEPDLPESINGEPRIIRQIIYDLVEYALQYSSTNQLEIVLHQDKGNGQIQYSVTASISVSMRDRLNGFFDEHPFQINSADVYQLVLVHAKLLSDFIQGKVWLESRGEETTFHFMLPKDNT